MKIISFWEKNEPNGNKFCMDSNRKTIQIDEDQIMGLWNQWVQLFGSRKFKRKGFNYFYVENQLLELKSIGEQS